MWTKDALLEFIEAKLGDRQFLVVANREPYQHRRVGGRIDCIAPVGGVVSALDPILRATKGIWIAHGNGTADRATVDADDRLRVPPDDPSYTLRRVWLSKAQENGYYNGLANSGLWPLCHQVFTPPVFDPHHWPVYRQVNELFAEAVQEEAGSEPGFVFIQDYHFGLLPRMLRESHANLILAQFWHIPWPNPDLFAVFPWKEELLDGLLGNDLLGFHLRYHCQNFLSSVERTLEAKVEHERFEITRGGKTTVVRPFPIGIDFDEHVEQSDGPDVERGMEVWREKLHLGAHGAPALGIGIDRLDYTKGIPERLRAVDLFLEQHPDQREALIFVQIAVPSRTHIREYQDLDDEIDNLVEHINWKWSTDTWKPIVLYKQQHGSVEMTALHRLADFCIVSALDDGMNLVAKEFVASRTDEDGVLILSQFTGAARELTSALLVNPFAVEAVADALYRALTMTEEERRKRMQQMRQAVADNNIYRWAGKFLSALFKFEFPENEMRLVEEAVA